MWTLPIILNFITNPYKMKTQAFFENIAESIQQETISQK